MFVRPALLAAMILAASAQIACAQRAVTPPSQELPGRTASLSHSALKATTFKIGTVISNFTILTYATGGALGGFALTAFVTGASWALYTANDYVWDTYAPPPAPERAGQAFDTKAVAWRNTEKYLTYKPTIAAVKYASIYAYTGSASITALYGTATILTNTVVFFANNMAWDWYDWYAASSGNPSAAAAANAAMACIAPTTGPTYWRAWRALQRELGIGGCI